MNAYPVKFRISPNSQIFPTISNVQVLEFFLNRGCCAAENVAHAAQKEGGILFYLKRPTAALIASIPLHLY